MHYLGVIPARYQSMRFPGKPLVEIAGIPMINRVYQQGLKSKILNEVVVATDSKIIYDHCLNANMQVIMTSDTHQSGTDRVSEVARRYESDVVVNIQGDEPFIPPDYIDSLCAQFKSIKTEITTLIAPILDAQALDDANTVKVVKRNDGRALYFSRASIPYQRNLDFTMQSFRHLGIYAFRRETLLKLADLAQGKLEQFEMLEQLRWLEAGFDIVTVEVEKAPIGVDVPEDVVKLEKWMKENALR
ncbi:MAG: 3-deoxy-manno-octulosonate cytidylyltransferase [Saprospiraceae bacterium]|nr:3-deoxy-manno-octulosonate cytidylyltransferase [Saprospiraceae bacterium]